MEAVQPKELIGLWDSAPFDFGATESTVLALLADGSGWTAVSDRPAEAAGDRAGAGLEGAGSGPESAGAEHGGADAVRASTSAGASVPASASARAPRVRRLAWDCPRPEVLEIRYDDYEFVRAQYTLLPEVLHLSQHLDSARQFALTRREVSGEPVREGDTSGARLCSRRLHS
ncbi:MAG TPA: hypothetical protein VH372_10560 [Actinospica sp.]|nr:hypothetical protein [Actinospica sp.]